MLLLCVVVDIDALIVACRDIAHYVKGTSADLVMLQEVFLSADADAIIAGAARGHLKYSQVWSALRRQLPPSDLEPGRQKYHPHAELN